MRAIPMNLLDLPVGFPHPVSVLIVLPKDMHDASVVKKYDAEIIAIIILFWD